jgi:mono/diheme cytochrome c family protein
VINEGKNLTTDAYAVADRNSEPALDSVLIAPESQQPLAAVMVVIFAIITALISLVFWLTHPQVDQYTQSVLSLSGDPVQGRSIFVMNCVACHGQWANGKVGPNLHGVSDRKSDPRLVQQVVSGETPPMPQFQPSPEDMADLLSYLKQL